MIHVCSLAHLHPLVERTGASHVITVMGNLAKVSRPASIAEDNHLKISMDDIILPVEGMTPPGEAHVARIVEFVKNWERTAPLVVHCFAGISRSTASAFVAACALNPRRREIDIARDLRVASPSASPNRLLVIHADRLLKREGRMIAAIESIGTGVDAVEGKPFMLDPGTP